MIIKFRRCLNSGCSWVGLSKYLQRALHLSRRRARATSKKPEVRTPDHLMLDLVHGLCCRHEFVSLSWMHSNHKPTTPCPSSSNPKSSPCASPPPWKCSPRLDPLHFLEQRHVLRSQTQDLVHMHGRRLIVDNHTKVFASLQQPWAKQNQKNQIKWKAVH